MADKVGVRAPMIDLLSHLAEKVSVTMNLECVYDLPLVFS
jgi:hypothetical protein